MSVKLETKVLDSLVATHFAELGEAVEETAIRVGLDAKQRAAIDTGEMFAKIRAYQVSALKWIIEAGAEHSKYVEFGTSKMKAQPFLTPAVEGQRNQFVERIARILGRL